MNRFNLTFSGEILTGKDPEEVKRRFGKMFAIDDPERLERFFSGQTIILRRNLERKDAAQYFHELHLLGAVASLVKVTGDDATKPAPETSKPPVKATDKSSGISPADSSARIWAVSSKVAARKLSGEEKPAPSRDSKEIPANKSKRKPINVSARVKALKAQDLEQREQEAAAAKAEQDTQRRKAAEERTRQEAEKQQKAAQETARRKAEQERQKAERAKQKTEQTRKKAEKAAKRKAERAAKQRREAEEAAKHKAELEEKQRREAEAAAKRKAELEEKQRREAEEAAKRKAELEEKQRREAAEAAKRKAELEEKQRREAAEAARRKAELEEKQRREAEEAARRKAELEEKQRREAEEAARRKAELEKIRQLEIEEAARLKAELEVIARQEAEASLRIKAEAQRKREEAERRSAERILALTGKQPQQRSPLPPDPGIASPRLTVPVTGRPLVKTSLETPRGGKRRAAGPDGVQLRKRQPGEPNLYQLRPFRNTEEVRGRSARAGRVKRHGYLIGVVALTALLIATTQFLQRGVQPVVVGISAITVDHQSTLVLLAADHLLFHDRAGIDTHSLSPDELGLISLMPPLAFDHAGALYGVGRLAADSTDPEDETPQLLRCDLEKLQCLAAAPGLDTSAVRALVVNPVDASVLLANDEQLLKINREGDVVARTAMTFSEYPVLRLHAGLLFINTATGPGIGVYRYEDDAFGEQLDEILLLPPAALASGQNSVGDFAWSAKAWWATLYNPETGAIGLYRFDEDWNTLDPVTLPALSAPVQLIPWGQKTLVNDFRSSTVYRYNDQGQAESPFISTQLKNRVEERRYSIKLEEIAWRCALILLVLLTIAGLGWGFLQHLRQLVYKPHRERGAEPVDDYADDLRWIDAVPERRALLRQRLFSYYLLVVAILLLAVAQSINVWHMAALLVVLNGPGIALSVLGRSAIGHIGILQDRLLLVDHQGMYHLASGSNVQYRGLFLMIDDVLVYTGSYLIPAFSARQIRELVEPLARSGVKIDRKTILVKLLQSRHPLALAGIAMVASTILGIILLSAQGLF